MNVKIGSISTYRVRYTQKIPWYPHTYVAISKKVMYRAANGKCKVKISWNLEIFAHDGARVEGAWTWWCWRGCASWSHGSTNFKGILTIQVLVPWKLKGKAKATPTASGLLGSWLRYILVRWHAPQHWSWGHLLYHRIVSQRGGGKPTVSWARRWAHYKWVHYYVLCLRYR